MTSQRYDSQFVNAIFEAQFLMGHSRPTLDWGPDGRLVSVSWDEDAVRQALHVPSDMQWTERLLHLEMQGLASFVRGGLLVTLAKYGQIAVPNWETLPREDLGSVSVHCQGVVALATLYNRPYVRSGESRALLDHWKLVQEASPAWMQTVGSEAQWAREWPEEHAAWHVRNQQFWADWHEKYPSDIPD